MNVFYKNMAIILGLSTGLQAIEIKDDGIDSKSERIQTLQKNIKSKNETAYKMWLMKHAIHNEQLLYLPEDIRKLMGRSLHELCLYENPVLHSILEYTGNTGKITFKIRELIKEGYIDLSNTDVFGDTSKRLLLTIDPNLFFHYEKNSDKVLILIAPKSLIEEIIAPTTSYFKKIMEEWDTDLAPIGIFYRMECWKNLSLFDYLINKDLDAISSKNLYDNFMEVNKVDIFLRLFMETAKKFTFIAA